MERKTEVKFWINKNWLCVQNEVTEELKTIKDQKEIALFLNALNLTVNEVEDAMYGYDVMGLFSKTGLPSIASSKGVGK